MDLRDKVCLVTGGSGGIGSETAIEFARRGADVAIHGRSANSENALDVCAKIEGLGRRCIVIGGDLAEPGIAQMCVEETVRQLGGIDVLVHSAGGPAAGSLLEVSPEVWYHAFDVHIHSIFHLCRAAVRSKAQFAVAGDL